MLDAPEGQDYTPAPSPDPFAPEFPAAAEADFSSEEDDPRRRLLLVSIGDEIVALPADSIVEIIAARPYARIPGTAECVAGLANRRGRILTVVDLGSALGSTSTAASPEHRIVVVSFLAKELGLAVSDVLRMTDDLSEDPQPRIVELDALLAPFFGGGSGTEEPTFEKS